MLLPRPLLLICIFVLSGTRLPAWRRSKVSQLVKSTLLASLKGQVNITGFQFLLTPLFLLLLLLLRRSVAVGNAAIVAIFQKYVAFVEFKTCSPENVFYVADLRSSFPEATCASLSL